jgi:glycosyltransferase involved in cell wall biosynthesis
VGTARPHPAGGIPPLLASIIIPVKDDARIFACLDSLRASFERLIDHEIIVVDNGSLPEFQAQLRTREPGLRVLDEPRPGAYAARNTALQQARGDVILFTDADCLVRDGWVEQAMRAFDETGAGIIQGFSGSTAGTPVARTIQFRYQAQYRRLWPGDGIECDTRNLAVRRTVFERIRFNDRIRRTGDTEFGLLAEQAGFRVAYWPAMRVDHAHETSLATFVAKQVCHGWGAQRIMREHPNVDWHGGHLKLVARVSRRSAAIPGQPLAGRLLARCSVGSARLLQRLLPRLPLRVAVVALGVLDKSAALSGHLMYEGGSPEPLVSDLLGEQHPRD